jgi:hypothetical protein
MVDDLHPRFSLVQDQETFSGTSKARGGSWEQEKTAHTRSTNRILWVKARPDYEPLFSILDGLRLDGERRYWIERLEAQEDNCDIEVDAGRVSTSVEILLQMSDRTSTRLEMR